jgi:hypothetical protein
VRVGVHRTYRISRRPGRFGALTRVRRHGFDARFGPDRMYPTLGTPVSGYLAATGTPWTDWTDRPDTEAPA